MKWHIIINFLKRFRYLLSFNPFQANVPLPYHLKAEKLRFSHDSSGYRSGTLVEKRLKISFLRFYEHIPLSWEHVVHAALRENDIEKLKEYFPCDADRKRVMADIYGTQNSLLLENGLADAENEQDFSVKLASLQAVWDNIAPGFHHWFKKRMSDIFIDCLILSSAERHGISKCFTTNGSELKHRLQK